jgi:hypothetical protein
MDAAPGLSHPGLPAGDFGQGEADVGIAHCAPHPDQGRGAGRGSELNLGLSIRADGVGVGWLVVVGGDHEPLTAGPVDFAPDGKPLNGRWKEVISVDGCHQSGVFNVMTMVKEGSVQVAGMLPGSSITGYQMQRDAASTAAKMAAPAFPAGCQQISIIDTAFQGYAEPVKQTLAPGRDPRSWRETWTVLACNKDVSVSMTFVPSPDGGVDFIASDAAK